VTARKGLVVAALAVLVAFGGAGCRGQAGSEPAPGGSGVQQPAAELDEIESTLAGIESELAGDGSP
jgi:hypothetical protein